MILLFTLIFFFTLKEKFSAGGLISFLISVSAVFSIVLGTYELPDTLTRLLNELFLGFLITMIIWPLRNVHIQNIQIDESRFAFKLCSRIVLIVGIICLVLNVVVVQRSFNYVLAFDVDITLYKNAGEAALFLRQWFPSYLITLLNILSPIGYLALAFHFYMMKTGRSRLGLIFLLVAMNIPLVGFHGLSRAASVQFLILYASILLLVYRSFSRRLQKKLGQYFILLLLVVLPLLATVTISRFDDNSSYALSVNSSVIPPVLYSILDYFSQWYSNGLNILDDFSLDKIWGGYGSFGLLRYFIGDSSIAEIRFATIGMYATMFNGLIANLVYDFTHIGALFWVFIYSRIISYSIGRKENAENLSNSNISFERFLVLVVLMPVLCLFFTNNALSNLILSTAVVVVVAVSIFLKIRFN